MRQPCIQSIQCPCPGLPLTNFSSEDPDRLVYLGRWYGYKTPSPSNIIQDPCASFSSSTLNQDDANLCAQASSNECQTGQPPSSPCDVCRPPTTGVSTGISFDLPGFASTGASSGDPCCDPDFPEECCCNSDPSDPNPPDNPPPGDPDNPGQPGVPTNPPRMFANMPQSCTVTCPSGASFTSSVSAGQVFALSQALADANAHAIACQRAEQQKECDGGGGAGCDCPTFCLDTPVDFQVGTAPEEGEEKSFELVDGDLPAGLSMDDSGKITGTPTGTANESIDVKITTGDGKSIILHTCVAVLGITNDSLPVGEVGVAYSGQLVASGGTGPYTFSVEFGFPTGLTLDPSTGQIAGVPDTGGSYSPLFRVVDSCRANCPVEIEMLICGAANNAITSVACPANPLITVPVNVPAGKYCLSAGGNNKNIANAMAEADAASQAAALFGACCHASNIYAPGPSDAVNQSLTMSCNSSVIFCTPGGGSCIGAFGIGLAFAAGVPQTIWNLYNTWNGVITGPPAGSTWIGSYVATGQRIGSWAF